MKCIGDLFGFPPNPKFISHKGWVHLRRFRFPLLFVNLVILFLITLFSSCLEGEKGLFILDPIDPRLPKYSETGNDVAGALLNGNIWKSVAGYKIQRYGFGSYIETYNKPLFQSFPNQDSLVITFEGIMVDTDQWMHLHFHLKGFSIFNFHELSALNGKTITLDGVLHFGTVSDGTNIIGCNEFSQRGKGQLNIHQVAFTAYTKGMTNTFIFSGTYGFNIDIPGCIPQSILYGRFDYVLDPQRFFVSP